VLQMYFQFFCMLYLWILGLDSMLMLCKIYQHLCQNFFCRAYSIDIAGYYYKPSHWQCFQYYLVCKDWFVYHTNTIIKIQLLAFLSLLHISCTWQQTAKKFCFSHNLMSPFCMSVICNKNVHSWLFHTSVACQLQAKVTLISSWM
jgi:hypothetical protein